MASKDYLGLRSLLKEGYSIQGIDIRIGETDIETSTIELKNELGDMKIVTSNEDDVAMLGFRWKHMYDKNGGVFQGFVRDTEEFYNNVEYLIDEDGSKAREITGVTQIHTMSRFFARWTEAGLLAKIVPKNGATRLIRYKLANADELDVHN